MAQHLGPVRIEDPGMPELPCRSDSLLFVADITTENIQVWMKQDYE